MKNHAVVISRFALECMTTMDTLTKRLEVTLGPDTGDLAVRIGLHSGPVTGKRRLASPIREPYASVILSDSDMCWS